MRVSYDKLWKILIDKKMKKYKLSDICGFYNDSEEKTDA